jgi:hypothetical protein
MSRLLFAAILPILGCLCGTAAGQYLSVPEGPTPPVGHWDLERLRLRDHRELRGYIESEDRYWLNLVQIERPPGRPMYLVIRPVKRNLVVGIDRLGTDERAQLRERIDAFRNRAKIEAARADAVELEVVREGGRGFLRYQGKWFTLDSDVDEPVTRQMIVRIEQVFTAYRQVLPPRSTPTRPLRLKVFGSTGPFEDFCRRKGIPRGVPACFVEKDNLVVAGSQMQLVAAQLAKIKAQQNRLQAQLDELTAELQQRLTKTRENLRRQGVPPSLIRKLARRETVQLAREIERIEGALAECERENARTFDRLLGEMFCRLHHEAFHAYLENYVYPHDRFDVPRWLNEGLAVTFEQGQLDSDTLRVDAPNPPVLEALKKDLRSNRPLSLRALLTARPQAFLADDASLPYAHSWGVAYYLTFERNLLDGPALDRYVQPAASNLPPVERFEQFVGQPLAEFERGWREYVLGL